MSSRTLWSFNVIRDVVPHEEFVPRLVEELFTEFLGGIGKERGYENAFGRPQSDALAVLFVLGAKAAVLELASATARARFVATG
jgi:hypothetical protein